MGEHQTRNISKSLEDNNTRLAKMKEQISSITMVLNDFSRRFNQFEAEWKSQQPNQANLWNARICINLTLDQLK